MGRPDLGRLAVSAAMDDMNDVVLELLARPLRADGSEYDRVVIGGQDIVHLMLDSAARQLTHLAKQPRHLRHTVIVTGERASAREMPNDVLDKELVHGAQVTAAESRVSRSNRVLVRLRHRTSLGQLAAPMVGARQQVVEAASQASP